MCLEKEISTADIYVQLEAPTACFSPIVGARLSFVVPNKHKERHGQPKELWN